MYLIDDCDFGVDEYGYKIISFEDSTVSIKYCGNKEFLSLCTFYKIE